MRSIFTLAHKDKLINTNRTPVGISMLQILRILLAVLAGLVSIIVIELTSFERIANTPSAKKISQYEVELKMLGDLKVIPECVLQHIVELGFPSKVSSAVRSKGLKYLFEHSNYNAWHLAYLTGYDEFKRMPPGPELDELIQIAKVLRDKLHLAFIAGIVAPKSELTIRFVIEKIFQDKSLNEEEKRDILTKIVKCLFIEKAFEAFGYLIEAVDDKIVESFLSDWGAYAHTFELSLGNMRGALKLCRLSPVSNRSESLFVIFCTSTNEAEFNDAVNLLVCEQDFIQNMLYVMIDMASFCILPAYFEWNRMPVYTNVMKLLDRLGEIIQCNADLCMLVRYVRLLYSIRFGYENESADADSNAVYISDETDNMITQLSERSDTLKDLVGLLHTVVCAQNWDLFARVLPHVNVSKEDSTGWYQTIGLTNSRELVSFAEWTQLMGPDCEPDLNYWLATVRMCKAGTVVYAGNAQWNALENIKRLVILAEIGDEHGFREVFQGMRADERKQFEMSMWFIYAHVKNPFPFVRIIQEAGNNEKYNFESESWNNFILLFHSMSNHGGIDGTFELLKRHVIELDKSFFERLFYTRELSDGFRAKREKLPRRCISVKIYSLGEVCLERIMELFEILGVPVVVNKAAFSLEGGSESNDRIADLFRSATTLETLDEYAKRPGFLACLYLSYRIIACNYEQPKETFEMMFMLRISLLDLLRSWYNFDIRGFVERVDWYTLLAFFIGKPDKSSWKLISKNHSFKTISDLVLQYPTLVIEFYLEHMMQEFKRVILPIIKELTGRIVTCRCLAMEVA